MLTTTGIEHGLVGPREGPRIWERHIFNCAVIEALLPHRSRVLDLGTGAGLPGIVLAIARPDLQVTLIEPLERRTRWLQETVAELRLRQVDVRRGRAEDFAGTLQAPVVTARAVAPLKRLVRWAWPLLSIDGRLLALKGQGAQAELEESQDLLHRLGVREAGVKEVGGGIIDPPSRVIQIIRPAASAPRVDGASQGHERSHQGMRPQQRGRR